MSDKLQKIFKNTKIKLLYFFNLSRKTNLKNNHEYYLLRNSRKEKLPSIGQFFCITKVLSPLEKKIFLSAIFVFIFSSLFLLNAFNSKSKIEVPKVYGEYIEGVLGSVQYINPIFSFLNETDQDLCSLVYSGLLKYDEKRNLITDLAVKYILNEENTEYTFELKKDVLWHDGQKFSADDILFTFDLIQDSRVSSPLQISFKDVKVEKIDEYTIKFILTEPSTSFLSSLTIGILPAHIWRNIPYEQIKLAQRNLQPIGTGPFKFSKLIKDEFGFIHKIELVRNENYYKNPPFLKKFSFEFFSDYDGPNGLISALREQKINAISFVPFEYREKITRKHIIINTLQLPQYTAIFFNQKKIDNFDLRFALAQALDKEKIVREVLENEAKIIHSPILEGYPGFKEIENKINFSISESNTLLDKNWERISADDYRELLKKEKVEYLISQEKSKIAEAEYLAISENESENLENEDSQNENQESATSTLSVDEEKISQDVENELNSTLDPAQIFYRYPKKSEDKKNILELNLVTVATPEYTKVAQIISGYWQDVGVKVNLKFVDAQDITREVLRNRDYDILIYGVLLGSDPDQYPFWHSDQIAYPGLNLSAYSNKDVDKILQDLRKIKKEQSEEIDNLYGQLQDKILSDLPAIFLYTPTYTYAQENFIKGFDVERISEPSDRFSNITDWYVKTKKVWKN